MRLLIFIIASVAVLSCRTVKRTTTQVHKTADSSAVSVISKTEVKKKESIGKEKTASSVSAISDSGYSRVTTITELYSDEFDFDVPDSVAGNKKPGLRKREIKIEERGTVKREQSANLSTEQKAKVNRSDSSITIDSTATNTSYSDLMSNSTTVKKGMPFRCWLYLLLMVFAILYFLNKRFNLWQILKKVLKL